MLKTAYTIEKLYGSTMIAMWVWIISTVFAMPDVWTEGSVAVGTDQTLYIPDAFPIVIPTTMANMVTKKTAFFYFSPTCPHCQNVANEIVQLSTTYPDVQWVGVATSSSDPDFVKAFQDAYGVSFPLVIDTTGEFAMSTGAKATPNVYVVDVVPTEPDEQKNASKEIPEGFSSVLLLDVYVPYSKGLAGIFLARTSDPATPFVHWKGYQGSKVCISCHVEEGKSWYLTHHAQAYYTIYKQEKTEDTKCVSCHVTGLGEPTGFQMGEHNSPLVGVGCEACHSASGPHDGQSMDASATCVACHDAEHSIQFSLEKGLPHIDHFAANQLTDDQIQERVDAIAEGRTEKPLLGFPEGKTVGSAVCASCHASVHPNNPHSNAMATLPRKKRQDVTCLQCHATPQQVQSTMPQSKTLSDFRVKEGVGCESCHGAGEQHAANPTKENIVGLGASCPVCVIESLCTSCHTPKWDPNWNLEQKLQHLQSTQTENTP